MASLHLASAVGDGSRGLRVRLALPERPPPSHDSFLKAARAQDRQAGAQE